MRLENSGVNFIVSDLPAGFSPTGESIVLCNDEIGAVEKAFHTNDGREIVVVWKDVPPIYYSLGAEDRL